jgi:hypothetical protein
MNLMVKELLIETPLKTRLQVSNEMMFINLLSVIGFRKDKMWTESENELLSKICKLAEEHTENQLKQIKRWHDDVIGVK